MIYNAVTVELHDQYYKMADSKTYINVPFAQKDTAKALGAKWDASMKKWYVPADKDSAVFAQWSPQASALTGTEIPTSKPTSSKKPSTSANDSTPNVMTYAEDKNFIAYNGNEPPWD